MNEQTKQQVIALGRLGWSLRRIQKSTGVRRETVAAYLREAGVAVRSPGLWGHGSATPTGAHAGPPRSKPAIEVTTDFGAELATGAAAHDATPAQVTLAWTIREPCVVAIPGAATVAQLEANAAAAELDLAAEEIAALDSAAAAYARPASRDH